ncbi:MAG: cation transporter [Clostridia bacterium]|nr:cation transporter [Clostridia bacterium]
MRTFCRLLAGFKAGVGIMSGSAAVINEAINNLTGAVSSVVTIIGTKLAGRAQRIRSARNA